MPLPTEPGVYRDVRGNEWVLEDGGRWQHTARRMTDGRLWPVNDHPGVDSDSLAELAQEPGVEVLPLTRADSDPSPPV